MSDNNGRRLSFIVCFVIFIIGNIGLALQTNYTALLILRMVQAVGGTAAIALTYAVVADIATSAERGKYMGYEGAGILVGFWSYNWRLISTVSGMASNILFLGDILGRTACVVHLPLPRDVPKRRRQWLNTRTRPQSVCLELVAAS
jgi:MFS family permease